MTFPKKIISNDGEPMLPVRKAAARLKCAPDYVSKLCREGKLRGEQLNGQWFIIPSSIDEFEAIRAEAKQQRSAELAQQRRSEQTTYQVQNGPLAKRIFLRARNISIGAPIGAALGVALLFGALVFASSLHAPQENQYAAVSQVQSPFFGTQAPAVTLPHTGDALAGATNFLSNIFSTLFGRKTQVATEPAQNFSTGAGTPRESSASASATAGAQGKLNSAPSVVNNYPIVERIVEHNVAVSGVTEQELTGRLEDLYNRLAVQISNLQNPGHESPMQNIVVSERIDRLSNLRLVGDTRADSIYADSANIGRIDVGGNINIGGSLSAATTTLANLTVSGNATTTGNAAIVGNLAVTGAINASSTLSVTGNTTLTNATSTNFFSTTMSSTNLFSQIAQIGLLNITGGSLFNNLATFSLGFLSQASTTIGSGSQTGGLTISGGATTTGNAYFGGGLGIGIATSAPGVLQVANNAYFGGNLFVGGNSVTLGNSSSNSLIINSSVKSNIVPDQNIQYDLGSPSFYWRNVYVGNIVANNISAASTTIAGTASATFTINSDNVSADAEDMDLIFFRGNVVPNALLSWKSATKRFEFNQALYIANQSGSLTTPTLKLQGVAGQTGDIFQIASSTGTTMFAVGPLGVTLTQGFISQASSTVGDGTQSGGLTISGGATTTGNAYIAGNVGIGSTTPGSKLDVAGNVYSSGFFNTSGATGGYKIDGSLFALASSTNFSTLIGLNQPTLTSSAVGNTSLGYQALNSATSSTNNTAIGYQALWGAGTSVSNTGSNTAVGYQALRVNTSGSQNTGVGDSALRSNSSGAANVAIGYSALTANTIGSSNTALGANALAANIDGSNLTAIGRQALTANTSGASNIAVGYRSMFIATTSSFNIGIGELTLANLQNTGTGANIAVGASAGNGLTTGTNNNLFGYQSGLSLTTGHDNTFVGNGAGKFATSTYENTVIGSLAGQNISQAAGAAFGQGETFLGYNAGNAVTTGTFNTLIGHQAGKVLTTGGSNTGVGRAVFNALTTGAYNVGLGHAAGFNITTGSSNVCIGNSACSNPSTLGVGTLTGSYNIGLGEYAGATGDFSNAVAIGNYAAAGASNVIVLGSASSTYAANVGIASSSPFAKLSVHANNGETNTTLFAVGSSTATATTTLFSVSNTGALTAAGSAYFATAGGNVGVGSTTPWGTLAVSVPDNSSAPQFVVASSSATSFLVAASGRVGIGTAAPSALLSLHRPDSSISGDSLSLGASPLDVNFYRISKVQGTGYVDFTNSNINLSGILTISSSQGDGGTVDKLRFGTSDLGANHAGAGTTNWRVSLNGGTGMANPGGGNDGGDILIVGGDTANTDSGIVGGNVYIEGGQATGLGTWGDVILQGSAKGNVGIGTTSPFAQLSIATPNGASGSLRTLFAIASSTATATTTLFTVLNNGNIGIGTATPTNKLEIQASGGAAGNIRVFGSNNDAYVSFGDNTQNFAIGIDTSDSNKFKISNSSSLGSSDRFTIDTSGNVGIGTTTPQSILSVVAASAGSLINTSPSGAAHFISGNSSAGVGIGTYTGGYGTIQGTGGYGSASSYLFLNPNGGSMGFGSAASLGSPSGNSFSSGVGIGSSYWATSKPTNGLIVEGSAGIGSSTPYAKLSVKGAGTTSGVNFQTTDSNNSPLATIFDNGRVGVGSTTPFSGYNMGNTFERGVAVGTTNNNAAVAYGLDIIEGGNNRRAAFFLDDSNATWGLKGNASSGGSGDFVLTAGFNSEALRITGTNGLFSDGVGGSKVGFSSSTPFSKFAVQAVNGETNTTLFAIGSSTATATSTLFSVNNTGQVGIGAAGQNVALMVQPSTVRSSTYSAADYTTWADIRTRNSGGANTASGISFNVAGTAFDSVNAGVGIAAVKNSSTDADADLVFITRPFQAVAAERMRIDRNGNVGIGTTTPYGQFSINPNGIAGPAFVIGSSTQTLFSVTNTGQTLHSDGSATAPSISFGAQTSTGFYRSGSGIIAVATGNQFSLPNGTVNSPSLGFVNDGTSGIYRAANPTQIGVVVGGVEAIRIDNSRNVGIGSTTPYAKLSVKGTGTNQTVNFQTTNTNDAPLFTILDNGNVGIGSSTPYTRLGVIGSGSGTGRAFSVSDSNSTDRFVMLEDGTFTFRGISGTATSSIGGAVNIGGNFTSTTYLDTMPTYVASINATGSASSDTLVIANTGVNSPGAGINFRAGFVGSDSRLLNAGHMVSGYAAAGSAYVNTFITLGTANSGTTYRDELTLRAGNVGIGTTSPTSQFSVQGNSYHSGTAFFGGAITATSTLNVTGLSTLTGGVRADGGIGVGIAPNASTNGILVSTSTANTIYGATYYNLNTAGSGARVGFVFNNNNYNDTFSLNGSGYASSGAFQADGFTLNHTAPGGIDIQQANAAGDIRFWTQSNQQRLTIQSAGNVGIGVATAINTNDLLSIEKDQNATTSVSIRNNNSGAAALSELILGNNSDAKDAQIVLTSSGNSSLAGTRSLNFISNVGAFGFYRGYTTATPTLIMDTSGNVGIGTTSPASLFSVAGDGYFTGSIRQGTNAALTVPGNGSILAYNPAASGSSGIWAIGNNGGQGAVGVYDQTSGHVGAYLFSAAAYAGIATINNAGAFTGNPINFTATNVGIGLTAPQSILHTRGGNGVPATSGNMNTGVILSSGSGAPALNLGGYNSGALATSYSFLTSAYENNAGVFLPLALQPNGGNVGVGTTTPNSSLTVSGASPVLNIADTAGSGESMLKLTDAQGNAYTMKRSTVTGFLDFKGVQSGATGYTWSVNNGTEVMRINNSGNVGVGNTNPTQKFMVSGADSAAIAVIAGVTKSVRIGATGASGIIEGVDQTGVASYQPLTIGGSFLAFTNSGTEYMRLTGGNLGIGTTSPMSALSVSGSAVASNLFLNSGAFDAGTVGFSTTNGPHLEFWGNSSAQAGRLYISNGGSSLVTVTSAGNVGIGTSTPQSKLSIMSAATSALDLDFTSGVYAQRFTRNGQVIGDIYKNTSGNLTFDSFANQSTLAGFSFEGSGNFIANISGNMGIGTTSPLAKLDVYGNVSISGSSSYLNFGATTTASGIGTNGYGIRDNNGIMQFKSASSTWQNIAATSHYSKMNRSTAQTIGNVTTTKVLLNTTDFDNGGLADPTTNNRFNIQKAGKYLIIASIYGAPGAAGYIDSYIYVNGSRVMANRSNTNGTDAAVVAATVHSLAVGDYVEMYTFVNGAGFNTSTSVDLRPQMSVVEIDGADYAEYVSPEAGTDAASYTPGSVICLKTSSPDTYGMCDSANDKNIVGIVSTAPAVLGNGPDASVPSDLTKDWKASHFIMAMLGRVPTKVSLEGGEIHIGDRLSASSQPGYAMKATGSARTIGFALADYTATSTGMIDVYIQPEYSLSDDAQSLLNTPTLSASGLAASSTNSIIGGFSSTLHSAVDGLGSMVVRMFNGAISAAVGIFNKVYAGEVHTDKLCISDGSGETCVTKTQLDSLLSGTATSTNIGGNTNNNGGGQGTSTADTIAPTITLIGNNPATISIGSTYSDNGATVSDNVDSNLGYKVSLDGGPLIDVSALTLDTSTSTTYTILFSATDSAGNTGTATRTVLVQ